MAASFIKKEWDIIVMYGLAVVTGVLYAISVGQDKFITRDFGELFWKLALVFIAIAILKSVFIDQKIQRALLAVPPALLLIGVGIFL